MGEPICGQWDGIVRTPEFPRGRPASPTRAIYENDGSNPLTVQAVVSFLGKLTDDVAAGRVAVVRHVKSVSVNTVCDSIELRSEGYAGIAVKVDTLR